MKNANFLIGLAAIAVAGVASAAEGPVPRGIPHLDHVFIIMMENHGYAQVIGNPNMPFGNQYARQANLATNYFAVAHPSLTNYLEVSGGSNFGVLNDNSPDWHDAHCRSNLLTAMTSNESVSAPICPIAGTGTDAASPAIDYANETKGTPGVPSTGDWNLDGVKSIPAANNIVGKTIADQLVVTGQSWKSYQEDLPATGADGVDLADGLWSNLSNLNAVTIPGIAPSIVGLYAAKHDPFVYFENVQAGYDPRNSLKNVVPFDTDHGLYADLANGEVPTYSFIAPNQCNDQHGRSNAGPFCLNDPNDVGTLAGLNPALMAQGDTEIANLVHAIHRSSAWHVGNSAIVVIWDENDYSVGNANKVAAIVDTNYGSGGHTSQTYYTHFSLLKSIEAGLGLPCLNHACDSDVAVMSDLFRASTSR
jgi:phosphatidylinositol-3-phosphatase